MTERFLNMSLCPDERVTDNVLILCFALIIIALILCVSHALYIRRVYQCFAPRVSFFTRDGCTRVTGRLKTIFLNLICIIIILR